VSFDVALKRRNLLISGDVLALLDVHNHQGIQTKTDIIRKAIRAAHISDLSPPEINPSTSKRHISDPTRICFAIDDDDYNHLGAIADLLETSRAAALEYLITTYLKAQRSDLESVPTEQEQILHNLWLAGYLKCELKPPNETR
jgi:hypothetical protein